MKLVFLVMWFRAGIQAVGISDARAVVVTNGDKGDKGVE